MMDELRWGELSWRLFGRQILCFDSRSAGESGPEISLGGDWMVFSPACSWRESVAKVASEGKVQTLGWNLSLLMPRRSLAILFARKGLLERDGGGEVDVGEGADGNARGCEKRPLESDLESEFDMVELMSSNSMLRF